MQRVNFAIMPMAYWGLAEGAIRTQLRLLKEKPDVKLAMSMTGNFATDEIRMVELDTSSPNGLSESAQEIHMHAADIDAHYVMIAIDRPTKPRTVLFGIETRDATYRAEIQVIRAPGKKLELTLAKGAFTTCQELDEPFACLLPK